jgi:plasmid stabilization system protein ParE
VSHFEKICDFIAEDAASYARIFACEINSLVRGIPDFPQSGRIVPEYRNPNLREKIYGEYRIVYRISSGLIEIVAICHGSRLLQNVLNPEKKS